MAVAGSPTIQGPYWDKYEFALAVNGDGALNDFTETLDMSKYEAVYVLAHPASGATADSIQYMLPMPEISSTTFKTLAEGISTATGDENLIRKPSNVAAGFIINPPPRLVFRNNLAVTQTLVLLCKRKAVVSNNSEAELTPIS